MNRRFKFTHKHRSILYAKLQPWYNKELVGCLLPTEMMYLFSIGCEATNNWWTKERCAEAISKGEMSISHCYIKPTKSLFNTIRERYKDFENHYRWKQ